MEKQQPPMRGTRRFKLLYATQVAPERPSAFEPPQIVLFGNDTRLLTDNYLTYLSSVSARSGSSPGCR